jgi:orotidine-5'-phosphate decarboxylase
MLEHVADRLARRVEDVSSNLVVGIDPRLPLPEAATRGLSDTRAGLARAYERYGLLIARAVAPFACAVKPQSAFFEALGGYGVTAFENVCRGAREEGLIVIADVKRGDIASTAGAYARATIGGRDDGPPTADLATVNAYLGADSLEPFLTAGAEAGTGVLVLTRTSNPGGADLQELELVSGGTVWEHVAGMVGRLGEDRLGRCGLSSVGAVVGLTMPEAIRRARRLAPRAPLLLPGLGAQGGQLEAARPAFEHHPAGGLVSASRSIIEAWRGAPEAPSTAIAAAARRTSEEIWALV